MKYGIAFLGCFFITLCCSADSSSEFANPRSLPSLRIVWQWDGDADEASLDNGTLFLLSENQAVAIDAHTGKVLWSRIFKSEQHVSGLGPVVMDDSVSVAFGKVIYGLDRKSGKTLWTREFDRDLNRLVTRPLFAVIDNEMVSEIIKLHSQTGKIIQRKNLPKVRELEIGEDMLILRLDRPEGQPEEIMGLRLEDLTERWKIQMDHFAGFARIENQLYFQEYRQTEDEKDCNCHPDNIFSRFDPVTGKLFAPLPQRESANLYSSDDDWQFQLIDSDDTSQTITVRRNDLRTGKPLWTRELNCGSSSEVIEMDVLYLHCDTGEGRGYFQILDWATGATRATAYGLRNVDKLLKFKEVIVATRFGDPVVAFSADKFGPPEEKTSSVESEVLSILGSKKLTGKECWWQDMDAAVNDLKAIGPEAYPVITKEIYKLSPAAVAVAARVLAEGSFTEAASELAGRLADLQACSEHGWAQHNPAIAVLQSLSRLGNQAQTGAIESVLFDDSRSGSIRLEAFASLTAIGGDQIASTLDRALRRMTPPSQQWWIPPDPGKHLQRFGTAIRNDEILEAYHQKDYELAAWLTRAESSVKLRIDGKDTFIFPYEAFGGQGDLWMIQMTTENQPLPAKLLGALRGEMIVNEDVRFTVDHKDGTLTIRAKNGKVLELDLRRIDLDSDADGLTDIVENRLHTNPLQKDTDEDGQMDSADLAPNRRKKAEDEQEQITQAIFQQYFSFWDRNQYLGLAIIVSDFALEWRGLSRPMITLTKTENKTFLEEIGYNGAPHITITPGPQSLTRKREQTLGENERVYSLTIYRGGLDAVGYEIIVQQIHENWYIKQIAFMWIS